MVWVGAVGGVILKLAWVDVPKGVMALIYLALGWVARGGLSGAVLASSASPAAGMVAAGGLLYTLGALVYAFKRPDPVPAVFGYHEVFHALVIAAAALQYTVIAFYVIPAEARPRGQSLARPPGRSVA